MGKKNGLIIDANGTEHWYVDDKLHRDNDLPAVNMDKLETFITALSKRTLENGFTEQEVLLSIQKIGELLDANGVTLADINLNRDEGTTKVVFSKLPTGRVRAHEIEFCITELSRFCDVRTLKTTEPKTREIVYVLCGYTSDIQAAIQLILLVKSTMDASFASFMATYAGSAHGKTLRTSFMKEFGVRMNARLRAIKIERTSTSNSTSLVVVKGEEVNKALHQKYPDIRQRWT